MNEFDSPLQVKVWSEQGALFTRPEFGAERVSYPVMTPSAARGVLEAIFWKPEFVWKVREIKVLKPIRHFSILRNEMNSWQSSSSAKNPEYRYFADDDRAQRHSLCLKDVAYIITADICLKPHANAPEAKYRAQFRRRVAKGQCQHQPYLGTREFSAYFAEPDGTEQAIEHSDELGLMLWDMDFVSDPEAKQLEFMSHDAEGGKVTKGTAKPKFFRASLKAGILRVPEVAG
ncbi:type I-C CRISPR-associated protein Cas5c [Chamaesiphon minutus]|uniref:pre-crRNA processing endonuclease n=1 Tax=Chamaesiphon minutus (strain ATCC 27169 / PCC 6605) TaxID=1173020 RepID=K9UEQ9_CHAP6|nr:type I-C CRISPR-associated protein Cas5c [Chamaesiphon minutus]AFY93138.1 CRISPR-associated protein Cas5, subtype I-C/DVULG [Chamaesiphon minutus PCC 6605]